ncbi:MAG: phosphate/phosphite/phosphonate ABC transporter substrate-binding protein [Desulfobaccales bacterium]|jgi:phosphonate transport system substrate-binding protein
MKRYFVVIGLALALTSMLTGTLQAEEKCLVMGLIPAEDPKAMIEQIKPMKAWMEKSLGRCITLFTATDYTGVIEAMRAKKVDFAWFGPFSYTMAHDRAGAEAFAVGIDSKGKSTYRSYLVATPETAEKLGISTPLEGEEGMKAIAQKLNNLKEKITFTFTDPASTSGYAVPRYFMWKVGLDPEKVFRKVGFSGTHDAAELMVKNKTVDMCADNDMTDPAMVAAGKISPQTNIIIWKSIPLPGSPVAYRQDLPENLKAGLKKAITTVPEDANKVTAFGNITGWQLVSDSDYALIKEVKKVIDGLK